MERFVTSTSAEETQPLLGLHCEPEARTDPVLAVHSGLPLIQERVDSRQIVDPEPIYKGEVFPLEA